MNEEELKQEAEEYLHKDGTEAEKLVKDIGMLCLTKKQLNGFIALFKQIYIDSAEPREKRIAELEEICQDLSDKFDYQVKQVMKLEKENAELSKNIGNLKKTYRKQRNKRIDDLQKENAELKADNAEWEKASDKWKNVYELTNNQLTKAKEYIKLLLMNCVGVYESTGKTIAEIQAEAEQFLKE